MRISTDSGPTAGSRDLELARALAAIDLRAAESALLARDPAAYTGALARARAGIAGAFDANAAPVKGDIAEIDRLAAAPPVIAHIVRHANLDGIVCLLGVSNTGEIERVDLGQTNRDLVLGNRVLFGSVNANRRHYDDAVDALTRADAAWLDRLIARRVPLDRWAEAFERRPNDVKTVVLFDNGTDL